jgi:MFS transporter, DHA1 family, multidrug resistance protein
VHLIVKPDETSLALTLLLGLLISLSALGTDLYVPALPGVADSFSAPVGRVQLTLTTYFLGLACGQLLWGPLSDRYGRRPVLITALFLMLAATAATPFAGSVGVIALARLAQGIGMSGGVVVARSVVRDLHAHEQAAQLLSRMMIVFSVVPIAAPLAGSALASAAGWPAIFWTYAAIAAALLVAVGAGLRETAPAARRSAQPAQIARSFADILGEPRFIAPLLLFLCAQLAVLAWVTTSAFTLVRGLGVPVAAYGWMFAAVMLGQIAGAWVSSRFVRRVGIARLLHAGGWLVLGAGAVAALLAWSGVEHWLGMVAPFCVLLFGTALIIPNATALALSPFPHAAGAAASLIGAIGFGCAALISMLLGFLFDGSARPMASTAALAGLGTFLFERSLARGKA